MSLNASVMFVAHRQIINFQNLILKCVKWDLEAKLPEMTPEPREKRSKMIMNIFIIIIKKHFNLAICNTNMYTEASMY